MRFFLLLGAVGAGFVLVTPFSRLLRHGYSDFVALRIVSRVAFCVFVLLGLVLIAIGPWLAGLASVSVGLAAGLVGALVLVGQRREAAEDPTFDPADHEGLGPQIRDVIGLVFLFVSAVGVALYS